MCRICSARGMPAVRGLSQGVEIELFIIFEKIIVASDFRTFWVRMPNAAVVDKGIFVVGDQSRILSGEGCVYGPGRALHRACHRQTRVEIISVKQVMYLGDGKESLEFPENGKGRSRRWDHGRFQPAAMMIIPIAMAIAAKMRRRPSASFSFRTPMKAPITMLTSRTGAM